MDDPTLLVQLQTTLTVLVEKVTRVEKAVLGNGQPGHEQRIRALENSRSVSQGAVWALSAGASVLGAAAALLIQYLSTHH